MCIGQENPLKVPKIPVLSLLVQVLLRYKVGATSELGRNFHEVYAAGLVVPIIGVSGFRTPYVRTCKSAIDIV